MATDRLSSRLALGSTNAMWSRTATCRAPIGWATWYWMHRMRPLLPFGQRSTRKREKGGRAERGEEAEHGGGRQRRGRGSLQWWWVRAGTTSSVSAPAALAPAVLLDGELGVLCFSCLGIRIGEGKQRESVERGGGSARRCGVGGRGEGDSA